ncbi:MAG: hypothetical protein JXX14_06395 [Deltaproteobacteria bacterium]|nr:hypothetical protein [Deltaproteobacteria bacterium]
MPHAIQNHRRACVFATSFFAVLFLLPMLTCAHPENAHPTIVMVSMNEQNSALYWYQGEKHINDELQLSNLNVLTTVGSPYAALNMYEELRRAADTSQADVAIIIYKTDFQNVRLMVYARGKDASAQKVSQYDFAISDAEESAEIVALKTAEVVAEVVHKAIGGTQVANPFNPPPPSSPPMAPRLKLALSLAISGMVSLSLGGVFHWQEKVHETNATQISARMKDDNTRGLPTKQEALRPRYDSEIASTKAFQTLAVAGYSLAGALLVSSAMLFAAHRTEATDTSVASPVALVGTGVVWTF